MGYYKDFEQVNSLENVGFTEHCPVVLVMWGGVSLKGGYDPFDDEIVIFNREEFLASLENMVSLN